MRPTGTLQSLWLARLWHAARIRPRPQTARVKEPDRRPRLVRVRQFALLQESHVIIVIDCWPASDGFRLGVRSLGSIFGYRLRPNGIHSI